MTRESPEPNPFESPTVSGSVYPTKPTRESADLTTVDWLICIFCSGIGCIIGLVRLIQGKPSAVKMIGFSLLFSVLWGIVRASIIAARQIP